MIKFEVGKSYGAKGRSGKVLFSFKVLSRGPKIIQLDTSFAPSRKKVFYEFNGYEDVEVIHHPFDEFMPDIRADVKV